MKKKLTFTPHRKAFKIVTSTQPGREGSCDNHRLISAKDICLSYNAIRMAMVLTNAGCIAYFCVAYLINVMIIHDESSRVNEYLDETELRPRKVDFVTLDYALSKGLNSRITLVAHQKIATNQTFKNSLDLSVLVSTERHQN